MSHLYFKVKNYLRISKFWSISRLKISNVKKDELKINMKKFPLKNVRNFGIIAHIDHGKSTLSDRLMEFTGNISKKDKNEQVLDSLQVEKERGITVKAQTVTLFYDYCGETYLLNLIDTPGTEAQTVANFKLASSHNLAVIPVINKIDLKNAKPEIVSNQLNTLFNFDIKKILKVSAKLGTGVEDVIHSVIENIPPPSGDVNKKFRALLYDSWYSQFEGVICQIIVIDGSVCKGDEVTSHSTGCTYVIKDLGILYPEEIPVSELFAGQAGYFKANIKTPKDAKVGDTWFKRGTSVEPLPMIAPSKPMVFAGIFPSEQSKTQDLKKAVEKLLLNDSSVTVCSETSSALGHGWRLGFLGLLHMEVFCQRLHQEFDTDVVVTAPGISYKIKIKGKNNIKAFGGEEVIISDPSKFPDPKIITDCFEPMILGTIVTPKDYYSQVLQMCMARRGEQKNVYSLDENTIVLSYKFPLSEVIIDFFNELKVISSGFASFDYEELGYERSLLAKVNIYINGKIVEDLSMIAHASQAEKVGRTMCLRLKECIDPQQFVIAIQACVCGKIIARENIKALRKNVTAKLYGGDVTRRMKLLQRQKEGKKNMRMIGNVQIPRNVFLSILKRD